MEVEKRGKAEAFGSAADCKPVISFLSNDPSDDDLITWAEEEGFSTFYPSDNPTRHVRDIRKVRVLWIVWCDIHLDEYNRILKRYSQPLMQRIKYDRKGEGEMVVTNAEEVEGYFRFPDLTEHCIYLIETLRATLKEDMPAELSFIQHYDEAKRELQRIVDMPDRRFEKLMLSLHQNKGIFPKRRREQFSELTDEEIGRMEAVYCEVYEL